MLTLVVNARQTEAVLLGEHGAGRDGEDDAAVIKIFSGIELPRKKVWEPAVKFMLLRADSGEHEGGAPKVSIPLEGESPLGGYPFVLT